MLTPTINLPQSRIAVPPRMVRGLDDRFDPFAARRRYDLLAVDIDGTLLRSDKRLSLDVLSSIHEATRRGVRVVLASARPPRSVREIYGHLRLDTLQINYNGALILHPPTKRVLTHRPLHASLARRVVQTARHAVPEIIVHLEVDDRWITDRDDPDFQTATSLKFRPDHVGPLTPWLAHPVTKVMLMGEPKRLKQARDAVRERFGTRIDLHVSDQHLIQIVSKGVDKAPALADVAAHYGVPQPRVMAIGDAPNDASMLRWAGLGVAMANAWDRTKDAADVVVPSNDKDGVRHAILDHLYAA